MFVEDGKTSWKWVIWMHSVSGDIAKWHMQMTQSITGVNSYVLRKFGLVNATNQSNRAFENSNQSLYREQQKRGRKSRNFRHWYSRPQINLHTIKAVKNKNPLSRLLEKLSIVKTFIRMLLKTRWHVTRLKISTTITGCMVEVMYQDSNTEFLL